METAVLYLRANVGLCDACRRNRTVNLTEYGAPSQDDDVDHISDDDEDETRFAKDVIARRKCVWQGLRAVAHMGRGGHRWVSSTI